jgi:hypothetical protein
MCLNGIPALDTEDIVKNDQYKTRESSKASDAAATDSSDCACELPCPGDSFNSLSTCSIASAVRLVPAAALQALLVGSTGPA